MRRPARCARSRSSWPLLGVLLGVPIVLLGRWLSRRLTAPIAELTQVIGDIADTDRLEARAPVPPSDELGTLARSFNRMTENLERTTREREQAPGRPVRAESDLWRRKIAARTQELEAAMRAQQRLIGDISHEIKSPLARLSMALGLARRVRRRRGLSVSTSGSRRRSRTSPRWRANS